MIDIDRVLALASQAMCAERFDEADRELNAALLTCSEESETDILLQQLVHLFPSSEQESRQGSDVYGSEGD